MSMEEQGHENELEVSNTVVKADTTCDEMGKNQPESLQDACVQTDVPSESEKLQESASHPQNTDNLNLDQPETPQKAQTEVKQNEKNGNSEESGVGSSRKEDVDEQPSKSGANDAEDVKSDPNPAEPNSNSTTHEQSQMTAEVKTVKDISNLGNGRSGHPDFADTILNDSGKELDKNQVLEKKTMENHEKKENRLNDKHSIDTQATHGCEATGEINLAVDNSLESETKAENVNNLDDKATNWQKMVEATVLEIASVLEDFKKQDMAKQQWQVHIEKLVEEFGSYTKKFDCAIKTLNETVATIINRSDILCEAIENLKEQAAKINSRLEDGDRESHEVVPLSTEVHAHNQVGHDGSTEQANVTQDMLPNDKGDLGPHKILEVSTGPEYTNVKPRLLTNLTSGPLVNLAAYGLVGFCIKLLWVKEHLWCIEKAKITVLDRDLKFIKKIDDRHLLKQVTGATVTDQEKVIVSDLKSGLLLFDSDGKFMEKVKSNTHFGSVFSYKNQLFATKSFPNHAVLYVYTYDQVSGKYSYTNHFEVLPEILHGSGSLPKIKLAVDENQIYLCMEGPYMYLTCDHKGKNTMAKKLDRRVCYAGEDTVIFIHSKKVELYSKGKWHTLQLELDTNIKCLFYEGSVDSLTCSLFLVSRNGSNTCSAVLKFCPNAEV